MKPADVSSLRMLRRARDRIDRDYADPIDIPALAAGAGYSREHFIRAFRMAYGETPAGQAAVERAALLRSGTCRTESPPGRLHLGTSARWSPACPPPRTGGRRPTGGAHPWLLHADVADRPADASLPESPGPRP